MAFRFRLKMFDSKTGADKGWLGVSNGNYAQLFYNADNSWIAVCEWDPAPGTKKDPSYLKVINATVYRWLGVAEYGHAGWGEAGGWINKVYISHEGNNSVIRLPDPDGRALYPTSSGDFVDWGKDHVLAYKEEFVGCTLWNKLGTGSNPKLHLELGGNQAKWHSFPINWGHYGNFPWDYAGEQWAAWNVKDEDGKGYGTITLKSNGKEVSWDNYVLGEEGRYLEEIKYPSNGPRSFELICKEVHGWKPNLGPFPDAPLAKPATYPNSTERIVLSVNKDGQIVNNKNKPLKLKGLCRPSLEWDKQGEHLSAQNIVNLCHWFGKATCNVIRVSLEQIPMDFTHSLRA
jgi:hypothetical protein